MMRTLGVALLLAITPGFSAASDAGGGDSAILESVKAAEKSLNARIGVAIYDTGSGRKWFYKADKRFPMASTSKALTCAALLELGPQSLQARVRISEADLQSYAPVTKAMVGQEISASDLCAAAMKTSDNTAINKVLQQIGGPGAVTSFLRQIGDQTSRLDRNEPSLNEGVPGDPRDTTTPRAMMETLYKLVLGESLAPDARSKLTQWLAGNEVGGPLLRAGIPADWKIADRTGAGGFGTRGVIAVIWPPHHSPIVAAVYLTETDATMDARNAAIASIGKAISQTVH